MKNKFLLFFVLLWMVVIYQLPALAECKHNGKTYPEGTRIGRLTCRNGRWV